MTEAEELAAALDVVRASLVEIVERFRLGKLGVSATVPCLDGWLSYRKFGKLWDLWYAPVGVDAPYGMRIGWSREVAVAAASCMPALLDALALQAEKEIAEASRAIEILDALFDDEEGALFNG